MNDIVDTAIYVQHSILELEVKILFAQLVVLGLKLLGRHAAGRSAARDGRHDGVQCLVATSYCAFSCTYEVSQTENFVRRWWEVYHITMLRP